VSAKSKNVFDNLPSLSAPTRAELRDEYERYLSTDPEMVDDVLLWWSERRAMYPRLSRMALDYLTIPGKVQLLHI
jgi:hAT family C-terminal dimerisation region